MLVRQQVLARATLADAGYGLQAEARPPVTGLVEAASPLARGLERLGSALRLLSDRLRARLEDADNPPDPGLRQRLDATIRSLDRRAGLQLAAWAGLLRDLALPPCAETVEWLALDRIDGLETDVAVNRNWIDPGIPFAELVARPAHGLVVTSATLTDGDADTEIAWSGAEAGTGLRHLRESPAAVRVASPFDYPEQTRVFIVTDIPRDDIGQVAAAYATLFVAARGGALGLFTAISRLKGVHHRIAPVLEARGLLLLAQHVEAMSTATLLDIFRAEEDSACSAPTPCATASTFRADRYGSSSSTGSPGRDRTSCIARAGRSSAAPNTPTGSPGCGCGRPMVGWSAARTTAVSSSCSTVRCPRASSPPSPRASPSRACPWPRRSKRPRGF